MRTFAAVVRTVFGIIALVLATIACGLYIVVISLFRPHNMHTERIVSLWARLFLSLPPATLTAHGQEKLDLDQQYVFVANHLSNFDIPAVLLAIPHRIRFLAKAELFKIPIFSQAMTRVGVIRTDRRAGQAAHASINEGVARAKEVGYSLIIFPEGTRSVDGDLHGFKKGAFRIAIANELPVVPVTISGTWEIWPPGRRIFYPGDVEVTIHDPIPVDGLTTADIGTVREKAHAAVASAYRRPLRSDA